MDKSPTLTRLVPSRNLAVSGLSNNIVQTLSNSALVGGVPLRGPRLTSESTLSDVVIATGTGTLVVTVDGVAAGEGTPDCPQPSNSMNVATTIPTSTSRFTVLLVQTGSVHTPI